MLGCVVHVDAVGSASYADPTALSVDVDAPPRHHVTVVASVVRPAARVADRGVTRYASDRHPTGRLTRQPNPAMPPRRARRLRYSHAFLLPLAPLAWSLRPVNPLPGP